MNDTAAASIIKLFIFLPLIIIIIYLVFKYQGKYLLKLGNGRIIKIVEKVQLSKSASLYAVLINEKPYVISMTDRKIEVLMELPDGCIGAGGDAADGNSFAQNLGANVNRLIKRKGMR